MIRLIFIKLFILISVVQAIDCQNHLFNININDNLSIEESLQEIANYCSFSIVIKDQIARDKLKTIQNSIHIKQMSLEEIFELFIKDYDLSYEFNGKVLKIFAIQTRTFKIDYITSVREGQSITKASVDARPKQSEYKNTFEDSEDNMIKSMEKFNFWENMEKEISTLLNFSSQNNDIKAPIVNANAGIVIVTGTNSQIKQVENYLQNLQNRLKKQVIIDVSIIAVSLNKNHSSGINWQNFNLDFNSKQKDNVNSFMQYQSGQGFVKNLGLRANLILILL